MATVLVGTHYEWKTAAQNPYRRIMSSRLEDLKTGLVKDFEAHKQHISHEGLFRCTLCEMYQKELSRLEATDQKR